MRLRLLWVVALLVAGCLNPGPHHPSPASDTEVPAWEAVPRAGLYSADASGLHPEPRLEGVTTVASARGARYSWNGLETLADNSEQLLLVQVLEDANVSLHLDTHVAYSGFDLPGSDRPAPASSCFEAWGFNITANGTGAFYLGRSLGEDAPWPSGTNDWHGPGVGHGHGASGGFVTRGDSFDSLDADSNHVPAGGYLLLSAGISQIPAASASADGNWWWMNWTIDAPHRIVRLPDVPLYCYFGMGETHDASQRIDEPIPYIQGSHLNVTTLFGSTLILRNIAVDPVSAAYTANNRAEVGFLDQRCLADASHAVTKASFVPGNLTAAVDQWTGYPDFILVGLGPWQTPIGVLDQPQECTAP